MLTVENIVAELKRLGNPNTAKIYARHGVKEQTVGLAYSDLSRMVQRIGVNHELALALWNTGLHDARVLATKIADPASVTKKQLEAWVSDVTNHVIEGAIADLVARTSHAHAIASTWCKRRDEWRAAAGWSVAAALAVSARLEPKTAAAMLEQIEDSIHGAQNRVRHCMNNALIAIGGSIEPLRDRALRVAAAIGRVEVDHGPTGCKTPDAASYIAKMVAHAQKKAQRRQTQTARRARSGKSPKSSATNSANASATPRPRPPSAPQT